MNARTSRTTARRPRRDAVELPKGLRARKRAVDKSTRALFEGETLDSRERERAREKIDAAIDRLAKHAHSVEGWSYAQAGDLESELRRLAREAAEQARVNYLAHLAREGSSLRASHHDDQLKRYPQGSFEKELAVMRGRSRDRARRS